MSASCGCVAGSDGAPVFRHELLNRKQAINPTPTTAAKPASRKKDLRFILYDQAQFPGLLHASPGNAVVYLPVSRLMVVEPRTSDVALSITKTVEV